MSEEKKELTKEEREAIKATDAQILEWYRKEIKMAKPRHEYAQLQAEIIEFEVKRIRGLSELAHYQSKVQEASAKAEKPVETELEPKKSPVEKKSKTVDLNKK